MNSIKSYRIKDTKTGEYLQRSGCFGKLARNYAAIGHLTLSILEIYDYIDKNTKKDLVIEEIETKVIQTMPLSEFYENAMFKRELKKIQEEKRYKNSRKKELLEELEKLNE